MVEQQREPDESLAARRLMVEDQIRRRGVRDQRVLEAMLAIPRDRFVPADVQASAYEDRALPVGHSQTISQPFIVAYMTEQLAVTPENRVLEIGTGTGYQTAILAFLAKHVFTVERIPALRSRAAAKLAALQLSNVSLTIGDGSLGLPDHAPYDRVIVTAAAPRIPTSLTHQLVEGGVLVIPVGGETQQTIIRVVREGKETVETPTLACRFVRLIGEEGWPGEKRRK